MAHPYCSRTRRFRSLLSINIGNFGMERAKNALNGWKPVGDANARVELIFLFCRVTYASSLEIGVLWKWVVKKCCEAFAMLSFWLYLAPFSLLISPSYRAPPLSLSRLSRPPTEKARWRKARKLNSVARCVHPLTRIFLPFLFLLGGVLSFPR